MGEIGIAMLKTKNRARPRRKGHGHASGIALVMVLLVLSALALIGTPFVLAMLLQERSSMTFEGGVRARLAAEAARNHAISRLKETVRAHELERAAEKAGILQASERGDLRPTRARDLERVRRTRAPQRKERRRGMVIREDLGDRRRGRRDERENRRGPGVGRSGGRRFLTESRKGPGPASYDTSDELTARMPTAIEIPDSAPSIASAAPDEAPSTARKSGATGRTVVGSRGTEVTFRDPTGVTGTARIIDEQGKVNLNTSPPGVIAGLFAVGVLERPLQAGETTLVLQDASQFPDDGDPKTISGAVVVVHPANGAFEAVTYRERSDPALVDCFRGAFFSMPHAKPFPIGSMVFDMRGWKAGYHRLRAGAIGGFASARLTALPTVEAIRDIANWHVSSLFLSRLRGEELTPDFLGKMGIKLHKLEKAGLDLSFLVGGDVAKDSVLERELDLARKVLRRKRVSRSFLDKLERQRGARGVIAFAAQVGPLSTREASVVREQIEKSFRTKNRKPPKFPRAYIEACLENLAEVSRTPGIETVRPEDLKYLRDTATVHSSIPTLWSEAQVSPDQILAGSEAGESYRVVRSGEHGGGAIVRLTHRKNPLIVEFNQTIHRGKNIPVNGFELAFPVTNSYGKNEARLEFLQRHPVNVNTAPLRVLRAVFSGVSGYERRSSKGLDSKTGLYKSLAKTPGLVTPAEARTLASLVAGGRPYSGPGELFNTLLRAADGEAIDMTDVRLLFVNSIQPNHHLLRNGTVGFCYDSGDVYTLASRGTLRDLAGGEVASATLREITEISLARPLQMTLFTQQDFTSEIYLSSAFSPFAPEDHHRSTVSFPGMRSHLVRTTPILYKTGLSRQISAGSGNSVGGNSAGSQGVAFFPIPGAENGTLRLEQGETIQNRHTRYINNFRETREGVELVGGGPWEVPDFQLSGGGGGAVIVGQGGGGSRQTDLSNVPASVEAWMRFRTFPTQTNYDGYLVIFDTGVEDERNRISLLYDQSGDEWVARIYDTALPDPSIAGMGGRSGQYMELRALRPLELDIWYHVKLHWSGSYPGGVQLFLDGLPVGRITSFRSELAGGMQEQGGSIPFRNPGALPRSGVVRIDGELVEYNGSSIPTLQPSDFARWYTQQNQQQGNQPQVLGGSAPITQADLQPQIMRGAGFSNRDGNYRNTLATSHASGANAVLHGYSLEIVRKIRRPADYQGQYPWTSASGGQMVLGQGGLVLAEDLMPWDFPSFELASLQATVTAPGAGGTPAATPQSTSRSVRLIHFDDQDFLAVTGPGGGQQPIPPVVPQPPGQQTPAGQIVPMFEYPFRTVQDILQNFAAVSGGCPLIDQQILAALPPDLPVDYYSGSLQWGGGGAAGQTYNAADWFHSKGVVRVNGTRLRYTKNEGPLPQGHAAATARCIIQVLIPGVPPVTQWVDCSQFQRGAGNAIPIQLKVLCEVPSGWLQPNSVHPSGTVPPVGHRSRLELVSLLANGNAGNLYPTTGLLELRGSPPPWQTGRRNMRNMALFDAGTRPHPDDTVAWIRYYWIEGDLFIYPGSAMRHRDYPRAENHFFHAGARSKHAGSFGGGGSGGEPLRQVVELARGGAGYGDYVTVGSAVDPNKHEPEPFRIHRVLEHRDGRFFASLYADGDRRGQNPLRFRNSYSKSDDPRLMKFPTGTPPLLGSGRAFFFADAIRGGGGRGGGFPQDDDIEEDPDTGFILDEVRTTRSYDQAADIRHVIVPLASGSVRTVSLGQGLEGISATIPPERSISRQNPLDILVVSVGKDPVLFDQGSLRRERGVLRINGELFYFENPNASGSGGARSARAGGQQSGGQGSGNIRTIRFEGSSALPNPPPGDTRDQRHRGVRWTFTGNASGAFEPQGFARIDYTFQGLQNLYEIFFYGSRGGGTFRNCLRGQFQTSALTMSNALISTNPQTQTAQPVETNFGQNTQPLRNVTTRIRLIGRSLLGSPPQGHSFGDQVTLVTCVDMTEITGTLTNDGLQVGDTRDFPPLGYALIDTTRPGQPFELMAYTRVAGENLLQRPLDEAGRGVFRSSFGSMPRAVSRGMFAYAMPYRHFDRYQPGIESEHLAYFQKAVHVPGAHWRRISWRERPTLNNRQLLCDIVVAARFDGKGDWSLEPTNKKGGLFLFEGTQSVRGADPSFPIGVVADEIEFRVYFRYRRGSFNAVGQPASGSFRGQRDYRHDWKETPILESLTVEYEKSGRIVSHEETEF